MSTTPWMSSSPDWPCSGRTMIASNSRLCVTGSRRAATIGALRTSAAGLLGLDLAVPETDREPAVDWQFPGRTVAASDPPWPVLRPSYRVLPGEPGRRRARQLLRDQIQISPLPASRMRPCSGSSPSCPGPSPGLWNSVTPAPRKRSGPHGARLRSLPRPGPPVRTARWGSRSKHCAGWSACSCAPRGSGGPVPGQACWLDRWRADRQTQPWRWGSPETRRRPLTVPGFW